MVVIKLLALTLFVVVGLAHIKPANYHPFAPHGLRGIHQGAAIVFFAYIGFDAISTAAEETKNPQRNMPIGILGGLAICTVIYVIVGAVLTGMVRYDQLAVADPLSKALQLAGLPNVSRVVALGADERFEQGRRLYFTRLGQRNFACASCHLQGAGKHYTETPLSPAVGQATHWPVIRDGNPVTLQTRIRECLELMGAAPFAAGSDELNHLEYFLSYLSNGLPLKANVWRPSFR